MMGHGQNGLQKKAYFPKKTSFTQNYHDYKVLVSMIIRSKI